MKRTRAASNAQERNAGALKFKLYRPPPIQTNFEYFPPFADQRCPHTLDISFVTPPRQIVPTPLSYLCS